jgi:hypothetical protein
MQVAHVFKSVGFVYTNGGAVQEMDIATLDRRIFARLHLRHALSFQRGAPGAIDNKGAIKRI